MSDCQEHDYIYTHEENAHHTVYHYKADDCPYCKIAALTKENESVISERIAFSELMHNKVDALTKELDELKAQLINKNQIIDSIVNAYNGIPSDKIPEGYRYPFSQQVYTLRTQNEALTEERDELKATIKSHKNTESTTLENLRTRCAELEAKNNDLEEMYSELHTHHAELKLCEIDKTAKPVEANCVVLDCGAYTLELGPEASAMIYRLQVKIEELEKENALYKQSYNENIQPLIDKAHAAGKAEGIDLGRREAYENAVEILHKTPSTYLLDGILCLPRNGSEFRHLAVTAIKAKMETYKGDLP
jgi:uncharacterized coiled-coil DUF342 family protein